MRARMAQIVLLGANVGTTLIVQFVSFDTSTLVPLLILAGYAGMRRFDVGSGEEKRSSYMTFRVMMEGSSGWIVPAKPGLFLTKQVADRLNPIASEVFSEAVKLDLGG